MLWDAGAVIFMLAAIEQLIQGEYSDNNHNFSYYNDGRDVVHVTRNMLHNTV